MAQRARTRPRKTSAAARRRTSAAPAPRWRLADLSRIAPQTCPCGWTRRAFIDPDNPVASVHLVDIKTDAQVHYHRRLTEIYVVLEGKGHLELDGRKVAVKPLTAVLIKPGCRHRAVGRLRVLVIAAPPFDPADEWCE